MVNSSLTGARLFGKQNELFLLKKQPAGHTAWKGFQPPATKHKSKTQVYLILNDRDRMQTKKRGHFQSKRLGSQKSIAKETGNVREIHQVAAGSRHFTKAADLAHVLKAASLAVHTSCWEFVFLS